MNPASDTRHSIANGPGSARYERMARAIDYCLAHQGERPDLATLAAASGLSPGHFQREFSQWVGLTPQQFLDHLAARQAGQLLREMPVLDAALATGLSGSGRLHDLMIRVDGVTPGEVRRAGASLTIDYGLHDSPFGLCFVATSARGICRLTFIDAPAELASEVADLQAQWPGARLCDDGRRGAALLPRIFPQGDQRSGDDTPLHLLLQGSPFQLAVWRALLAIPEGEVTAYTQVATAIGRPTATRAVASAIARNRIGVLIPCHRVIRASGALSNYRWGATRKQALLAWEAERSTPTSPLI